MIACGSSDSDATGGEPSITCDSGCIDGQVVKGPPGQLDPSFAKAGVATVPSPRSGSYTYFGAVVRAADGSLFVASYSGEKTGVAHLFSDGSVDRDYGDDGLAIVPDQPTTANNRMAFAVDAMNRVIVVQRPKTEDVSSPNGYSLVRLAADGSPDASFGTGGVAGPFVEATQLYPMFAVARSDGKVMLAGFAGSTDAKFGFALHGADGARDPAFSAVKLDADAPEILSDLVALGDGSFVTYGAGALRKYDANGTPDGAFGTGGVTRLEFPTDAGEPSGVLTSASPNPGLLVGYTIGSGDAVYVGTAQVAENGAVGSSTYTRVDPSVSGSPSVSGLAAADDRVALGGFEQTGVGSGHVWLAELQPDASFYDAFADGVASDAGFVHSGAYQVHSIIREPGSGKLLVAGVTTGDQIFVARVFQ